jgi:hypothetical protein
MVAKEIKTVGGKSLPLREFEFKWFSTNPSICMIAKRRSGKSWLVRAILKYFKHLPGGVIIAPTERMSCFYGNFFPELYIHYEYKSEILESLLYRQNQMVEKCQKRYSEGKRVDPRAFLVMDDSLASKGTWMSDQPILEIFYNGRHYQLLFILTMQFPLGIKPELRCNFDYIFLLNEDFYSNQKRIYEHYAGMFPSFDSFRQVFTQLTTDYGSMVIANNGAKKDIIDKVFYYRANNEDLSLIGCNQFKEFHQKNFNPNWKNNIERIDTNKVFGTKRGGKPNIVVNKIEHGHRDDDRHSDRRDDRYSDRRDKRDDHHDRDDDHYRRDNGYGGYH